MNTNSSTPEQAMAAFERGGSDRSVNGNWPKPKTKCDRNLPYKPKPKILIIGHATHGKDHFAKELADALDLKFTSSSMFVAQEILWKTWGQDRYEALEDMYEDRMNHRPHWANMISEYNTPDKTRTASTMFSRGNDMYVGMRRRDELEACNAKNLFDLIIWVDASEVRDPEPNTSMELNVEDADVVVNNNSVDENNKLNQTLDQSIADIGLILEDKGFNIGTLYCRDFFNGPSIHVMPPKENRLTWEDKPEGATTILDHGFIQLKETMGSDKDIAESARMSYGRGTKKVNNDEGLINYLINNHHTSPVEMGEMRFHIRMPIFVARQWIRHRTANLNEYSGRYSKMVRLFYVPETSQICYQHSLNKQMSANPLPKSKAEGVKWLIQESSDSSFDIYEVLLDSFKLSRETARMVLPLNTYTEIMWKIDMSNLIKFLYLRDDPHTQWETQQYAKFIATQVEIHFPMVYNAYMRQRSKVYLTQDQINALITKNTDGLSKSETAQVIELINKHLGKNY